MFPLCLETRYTQLVFCLSEIQNLSLQPLQGPVLGAVTLRDLRNVQILLFDLFVGCCLWTVSAPIASQVALFVCFLYRF